MDTHCNHADAVAFVQPYDRAVLELMPAVCGTHRRAAAHVDHVARNCVGNDYRHHFVAFVMPWDFVEPWRFARY